MIYKSISVPVGIFSLSTLLSTPLLNKYVNINPSDGNASYNLAITPANSLSGITWVNTYTSPYTVLNKFNDVFLNNTSDSTQVINVEVRNNNVKIPVTVILAGTVFDASQYEGVEFKSTATGVTVSRAIDNANFQTNYTIMSSDLSLLTATTTANAHYTVDGGAYLIFSNDVTVRGF